MNLEPATKRQAEAVTSVWWDISRCPLPPDVDARRVGPFIRQGLKKLGYSGPLTITAIGILSQVPPDVLQKLSSSGIHLIHTPTISITHIYTYLSMWGARDLHRSNLMLISLQPIFRRLLEDLSERHYILGSEYPPPDPQQAPSISVRTIRSVTTGCYLWESLLASIRADAVDSNLEDEEVCSGTGESTLYCSACFLGILGVGNLTTHLKNKEHALGELEYYQPEGLLAARRLRSQRADAFAIQAVLDSFRETARDKERGEEEEEVN